MGDYSHIANAMTSSKIRTSGNDICDLSPHNSQMAKTVKTTNGADGEEGSPEDNRNYLKQWLDFRKISQASLAKLLDTSPSVVSDLVNGNRQLSPKWLRRIAPLLQTTPGHLLDHDPNELPTDILELWANVDPALKQRAVEVLKAFQRDGTND